jgi:hypothetical protein
MGAKDILVGFDVEFCLRPFGAFDVFLSISWH